MQTTTSDVRERPENVLNLADYETEVTKEDVTVLKDDWLTDNVWGIQASTRDIH